MRLYLYAESKNKIGYIPDWLKVMYEKDGQGFELVLDIQGSIDYKKEKIDCRCKGDLVPWALVSGKGEEIDLSSLSEEEVEQMLPYKEIAEIIRNSKTYEVGIYPVDESDEVFESAKTDKLSKHKGRLELYYDEDNQFEKDFVFSTELTAG